MFGSVKENNLDFVVLNEMSLNDGGWMESHNLSSSTLLDFSSSYLDSADMYMRCLDPNLCSEETDMKPIDDYPEFFDDRLNQAIEYLNERCIMDTDLLVQLWLPVVRNGKRVLTIENQPFMVNSDSTNLSNYREVSKNYHFAAAAAEYDSNDTIGLPGLVFLKKFPSCTPDLQFIAQGNDPRVSYAQKLNIRGCLNLPVFEVDSETCLAVMEVITTSQKVNFRDELENISRALEAVDLRSCEFLIHPKLKDFSEPYQVVLAEIRYILRSICETLKLPLAQTWGRRSQQPVASISVIESASYVFNPCVLGYFEACSMQQLVQGEGIAGKALATNQPCFTDINDFCKADYPLTHEGRMFGMNGSVAIRLHSTNTGPLLDFILEFFLPRDCKGHEQQRQMRSSIASLITNLSWSLHLINDEELAEEAASSFSVKEANTPRDESWISHLLEAQKKKGENVILSMGCQEEEPEEEQHNVMSQFHNGFVFSSEPEKQTYFEWGPKSSGTKRSTEKSRVKTERNISLQVLQQYFPGSIKVAAKSIGVCPTTLKRICRQHGIMRWPSRKIKKVSRSLKKLQLVIDSVQGSEGMIKLGSFYTKFPELSSAVNTTSPKTIVNDRVNLLKTQTVPSNSSSSCSRGSSGSTRNATSCVLPQEETKLPVTSENDKLVDIHYPSPEVITNKASHVSQEEGVFRVKASYGNEKIRFKMLKHWGFGDLQHEITRRFNIYDMANIRLEYIDDDSEWVLLACDDDLVECMDLHTSTKNQTIKLFLHSSFLPMIHPNSEIHMC